MDTGSSVASLKKLLDGASSVLVLSHEHPTHDSIGSSLALSLGLESLGKKVTVACPDEMTVEFNRYIGVQRIVQGLSPKNFVVSLEYVEGSIEKVSYNIEGNRFNLVIEPRAGFPPFSKDKVQYFESQANPDLIITVDTIHLGGLKGLYEANSALFGQVPVVSIDRHPNNAKYATVQILEPGASSTVEVVADVLSSMGVALSPDIATNILNTLYFATANFQGPNVSGRTFEIAAACLKAGGRRLTASLREGEPGVSQALPFQPASQQASQSPKTAKKQADPEDTIQEEPDDWLNPGNTGPSVQ